VSTWIVSGASRGLGRQLALQLAQRGHAVIALARESEALRELPRLDSRIVPLVLDLADAAAIAPTLHAALRAHDSVEGVINNAGIGSYKPFLHHSERELIEILQVNLIATMQVCHALLPRLLEQGRGHIVNIGSDLGRRPLANMAPYVASKHGLAGFSHSLLREVKDRGVRVSLVQPGIIDTGFGGHTEGTRDDVASLDPAALAHLILQLVHTPDAIVVDEITLHPRGQTDF
jgi:short-subunit dehydrogenase